MTKLSCDCKTITNLYAFHRIDAHHGMCDVGIQTVKYWLTPTHRHIFSQDFELGTTACALLTQGSYQLLKTRNGIDITTVPGTGTRGLITRKDVQAAIAARTAAAASAADRPTVGAG